MTTLWYDCIMVSWCGCSLSKTLVGSCIAFFGLNCCLAGRSVACKAADILSSLINTYWFPGAIAGMVTNMYIWTVFCDHNSFLARRFWHYSGCLLAGRADASASGDGALCWCVWCGHDEGGQRAVWGKM